MLSLTIGAATPLSHVVVPHRPEPPPSNIVRATILLEHSLDLTDALAENGCQVLVPVLIDRADTWSGVPAIRMTNQPHREWIYRMAFEAGRHIIGYEVQKVLAAVDWFTRETVSGWSAIRRTKPKRPPRNSGTDH